MNGSALVIGFTLLLGALALLLIALRMRRSTGLPAGRLIYTDTSNWQRNMQSLYSHKHRLAGKPDYLIQDGKSVIPVELKSGEAPQEPREGHVMQLAAYCLLVEETYQTRPTYGIIQYADRQFAVDYTDALRTSLLEQMTQMRTEGYLPSGPHRSHTDPSRCAGCGVRHECNQRL